MQFGAHENKNQDPGVSLNVYKRVRARAT